MKNRGYDHRLVDNLQGIVTHTNGCVEFWVRGATEHIFNNSTAMFDNIEMISNGNEKEWQNIK